MKIAFTTKGTDWDAQMDSRFGRAEYFLIYDEEEDSLTSIDNTSVADIAHGAGPRSAQKLLELRPDVLITGNGPGGNAATVLQQAKVKVYTGASDMTAKHAYDAYKNGEL